MELMRGVQNIRRRHYGCVASVGNYDGIHLGHHQVVRSLAVTGVQLDLPVTIITFEPHPMEFFVPDRAPPRLMTMREKIEAMMELGVDRVCCLRFDHDLANTEPEDFVSKLLVEKLGVRHIVVGDDFRFGRNRRGDFEMLQTLGSRYNMVVNRTESFKVGRSRVSSTRIRELLKAGNLAQAALLLGRDYSISGRVARGDGNGKRWGFATANIVPDHQNLPTSGIFIAEVDGVDPARPHPAAASLGIRPTVGGDRIILEVHLLDFEGDLYGKRIRVRFLKKIRDEVKFDSVEAMIKHIRRDIAMTRKYFDSEQSRMAS